MQKHFCDICETELSAQELGQLQFVFGNEDAIQIAIGIRGQNLKEVCTNCLGEQAGFLFNRWRIANEVIPVTEEKPALSLEPVTKTNTIQLKAKKQAEDIENGILRTPLKVEEIDLDELEASGLGAPE